MVHAIPVTIPPAAWRQVRRRDTLTGKTIEETHAVWHLEGRRGGGNWRVVNAGGIIQGGTQVVRGRFQDDETEYRVSWVPEGGGGFIFGETGTLDGSSPAPTATYGGA